MKHLLIIVYLYTYHVVFLSCVVFVHYILHVYLCIIYYSSYPYQTCFPALQNLSFPQYPYCVSYMYPGFTYLAKLLKVLILRSACVIIYLSYKTYIISKMAPLLKSGHLAKLDTSFVRLRCALTWLDKYTRMGILVGWNGLFNIYLTGHDAVTTHKYQGTSIARTNVSTCLKSVKSKKLLLAH